MRLNRPLASLLAGPFPPDRILCFGAAGRVDAARFRRDVAALAATAGRGEPGRWLVRCEDAYRVAVCVMAAAAAGARAVLPPNLQPGTLAELGSRCARVFGDDGADDPLDAARPAPDGDAPLLEVADRRRPLVELYTSGSSGPGKVVTKALAHLEDEVVELERGFGGGLGGDTAVLATVPAHHLYGLLFRVLWPLAAGRPFGRESFLLPDELLARASAHDGVAVVSSPAHLRHLAASPRLPEHASRIRAVFSSGGPLETRTALDMEAVLGAAPLEIFGSTETGGVASRRASADEPSPAWTPFAPVRIATADDGSLRVTSPFVTAPGAAADRFPDGDETWTMGDRVETAGGGFRLLGRSDRIAKVGEKTLSLPGIEATLAAHDAVESAVVGTYGGPGGDRLGAVVVLTAEGRRRLAADGRRALQAELASCLSAHWDRVALPRRWRFREEPVADARGKFPREAFEAELARPVEDPVEPVRVGRRRDGEDDVLDFVVPRDLAYFSGHYENFPLVPGAVQLQWVLAAAGRLRGRAVHAEKMEAVKFRNVMRPGQAFSMRLRFARGEGADGAPRTRVAFTLESEDRVFSSGRMTLAG